MFFNESYSGNKYNNNFFNDPLGDLGNDLNKPFDSLFTEEEKLKIIIKRFQNACSTLYSDYNDIINLSKNNMNKINYLLSDIDDIKNNIISGLNKKRKREGLDLNFYVGPHFYKKNDKEIYCFKTKTEIVYDKNFKICILYCINEGCNDGVILRDKNQFEYVGEHSYKKHLTIENITEILADVKYIEWIRIQTLKKDGEYLIIYMIANK